MQLAANFLVRFKNLQAPERSVRAAVIQAAQELVGVELMDTQIKISKNELYINVPSTIKAALFENKKPLVSRINTILGKEQITGIR